MRELIFFPDPRLRQRCAAVEAFDQQFQDLVADLQRIIGPYKGLAAPQIGALVRIFYHGLRRQVFINPRLLRTSGELEAAEERCLSIPDRAIRVMRPVEVEIEAQDEKGRPFCETLTGLEARVACHELDHLDGILILDREWAGN